MKDMKKIYMLNNSQGVISLFLGLKSRITSTKPLLTMLALLMVCLFGVNVKAWATWPTYSGSCSTGGYVLVADGETYSAALPYTEEYDLAGPGATLTFKAHKTVASVDNSIKVYQYVDGAYQEDAIFSKNDPGKVTKKTLIGLPKEYGYEDNAFSCTLSPKATKIKFVFAGSLNKYIKEVRVTRAVVIDLPSSNSVDFGAAEYKTTGTTSAYTQDVTIDWANVAAMSTNITGSGAAHFNASITNNSSVGSFGTATVTITYDHEVVGTHSATLTVGGKTISLSGTTDPLQPDVTWSSNADYFNVDDILTATNGNNLEVTLSSAGNAEYVSCSSNSATMLKATSGTITITAHVKGNDIYADKDIEKVITITNLEKQTISWSQDFSRLKTTDETKSIVLNATASSGLPVTYELSGDKTGLTLSQNGNTWTLSYSASECKNTTILAKQAGDEINYAPASSVSLPVKVVDPTKVCDMTETLVNSQISLKAALLSTASATYNIDIPASMTVSFSRMKTGLLDGYLQGVNVEFYSEPNGTGTKLYTKEYSADDINKTLSNSNIDLSSYINAKSVMIVTSSTNGYYIDAISYSHQKYCTLSDITDNTIEFSTYPSTTTSAKKFTVNYANYPISLECSNNKFTFTPTDGFGDCSKSGSQEISVKYTAGASAGNDTGYIYVKDNTGAILQTCTLSVSISKLSQSITEHSIATSYKTTDKVTLSAVANSKLTAFKYSASPEGVASFNSSEMTFLQSGEIAITILQEGDQTYAATSTTVENVVVSKSTPDIATNPTGTSVVYQQTLENSKLSGGAADITLRGAAHTDVPGSFAWTEPTHVVLDAEGSHNYSVTFTPTDGGMYTTKEFTIPITITRATQALAMKNGTVKVSVDGIDEGASDSYLNLNTLIIAAQTTSDVVNNVTRDGEVTYEVISANKEHATISGSTFSATVCGTYTIRATKAQTAYYNQVTADFTVTVEKRANTLATAASYTKYVDDEVEIVATQVNSDGTIHTSSSDATVAYYDVTNNKIVIPNSAAKSFNQKEVTIKIWQDATARFDGIAEAYAKTIVVTVKKYDNEFSCSWGSWTKRVNFEDVFDAEFTTNNTDYTHSPIQITQATGATVATLVKNDDTHCTITASYTRDDATWNLYQAENYKYKAATKTGVKVEVRVLPAVCYLYEDNTEHTFSTAITDISGHFDQAVAISGPVKQIWFDAKKDLLGVNYFYAQYSVDNGANWRDIANPDLSSSYETYGPYDFTGLQANEKVTHIRFGAKTGATESKYYKNVKVSRATSIKPEDENGNLVETLVMPQNTIGGTTTAKFYMNYSSCDDVIKIVSNNEHFTVDQPEITVDQTKGYNRAEVTVYYTANAKGTHTGTITLYTKYQNRTFTVTGTTDKKVQTLEWQPGFEGDPMTLSVGLTVDNVNKAAVATSEKSVVYSTDNADVIKITLGGLGFEVVGEGTATLIASEAGDDYWFSVSDTVTVNATNKKIQVIVWDQDLMRGIAPDDVIDLEAKVFIRNMSDGSLTEDVTRTPHITYSCEANSVIALNGKQITVLDYGEATIIANVAGNETYEAAQPVTMYVKVRQPSAGCETPLVLDHADNVQLFSMDMQLSGGFSDWTTPEITSAEILLDPAKGKPDKLSYQHNGELYVYGLIKLCRGTVVAQQRVNGQWSDIEGSTYNNGGKEGSEGAYDWRLVEDLQLDENADAIRFRRLNAGQGYHNFKDIKITLKQYLRPTVEVVDLADIEIGEARKATIGFEFSDIKGDLLVDKSNPEDGSYTIDSTIIIRDCGAHGHFDLPITITPTELGEWSANIIVTDNFTNLSTTLAVVANVTEGYKYVFSGGEGEDGMVWNEDGNWDDNNKPGVNDPVVVNSDVIINGNVTVGSLTISDESTVTVTVTGNLTIGSGSSSLLGNYGNLHIEEGGKVNVGTGALLVNDLILDATLGTTSTSAASGQLKDENQKLVLMNNAYFQMSFDPSGQITYGWYDFVVPFEVDIPTGIFREGDLVNHLVPGVDFIVMEHSETARAAGQKDWKVTTGTMLPGRVYTITFDDEVVQNTFLFQKKQGSDLLASDSYQAVCSAGDSDKRGWNGLGNGTLQHKQMKTAGMKVQLYDHTNNVYVTREADDYIFAVGTSFFVQVNGEQEIEFANATNRAIMAPAREARTVNEFRLALKAEDAELAEDHMWISASEEATGEYTIGHDLLKMGTPTSSKVAQVWTTRDNMNLCDIEMPLNAGKAATNISLYTPTAGLYTLEIEKSPEDATLYLTKNGKAIWNLSMSPFELELEQGTTEGYGLRIVASEQTTTDIENGGLLNDENGVRKVLIDDQIYIVTPEGKMYDIVGKGVKF